MKFELESIVQLVDKLFDAKMQKIRSGYHIN